MKKLSLASSVLLYCLINCTNSISNQDLGNKIGKNMLEYQSKKDKAKLLELYSDLNNNSDYNHKNLDINLLIPTIKILIDLEKYDEAINQILDNPKIEKNTKEKMINDIEYHKYKDNDLTKAKSYLKKNFNIIKEKIKNNPQDTLLYSEYFMIKLHLDNEEKVKNEIDSLFPANNEYRNIFKDMIKEYGKFK